MNADAIRERVSENMRSQGLAIVDLRVQPDPFDGWKLWLVSDAFQGMPPKERRALVLAGLEGEHFEWLDILTSEEMSWAGKAPLDSDLEDLPLWSEAQGRVRTLTAPIDGLFASDLDEDLEPPLIGTFYSLKGGVGRHHGPGLHGLDPGRPGDQGGLRRYGPGSTRADGDLRPGA